MNHDAITRNYLGYICVVQSVAPFAFDRLYAAWFDRVVAADAKAAVQRSAERYCRAIA